MTTRRALLSVSDKTGIDELGPALAELGFELVASGGTAKRLRTLGLNVLAVEDITGFPEILGGRVKTLHPGVHGGILSTRSEAHLEELSDHGLAPIDLVVCNLYPFEATVAQEDVQFIDAIEKIDIGGVTLLRAAAKNCAHVAILCDSADYGEAIERIRTGEESDAWRRGLALKAFAHTAHYDAAISGWFADEMSDESALPARFAPAADRVDILRYGENPHQSAGLYQWEGQTLPFEKLQGKALSYNNLIDLDGAWSSIEAFEGPAVGIIKHTNPCGLAVGADLNEAFKRALASDPVSAFGSIVAVNRGVDVEFLETIDNTATEMSGRRLFMEVLAAPSFTADALEWLAGRKKNCRAVRIDLEAGTEWSVKSIRGGLVVQSPDTRDVTVGEWKLATETAPTEAQMVDLALAWRAVKVVKSNAIVLAKDGGTVGVGAGQMNRVGSVVIAARQAGEKAQGSVLASDAFFPFADGLEAAAEAGVVAIAQPGGSMRDEEVIAAANRLGIAMMFTGVRHFKH